MKRLVSLLAALGLVVAACTSTSGEVATTTSTTVTTSLASGPSTTVAAVTGTEGLRLDRGVDVESGVISLGLIGAPSDAFRAGYVAYWDARNAGGGVGGFSVEVAEVVSSAAAADLDLVAASIVGADPGGSRDLALVGDLIRPAVRDVVAMASTFPGLLDGADVAAYDIVVDATSPAACREAATARTVVEVEDVSLADGAVAVVCTRPQATMTVLESGGEWTALAIVAWSWDPAAARIVGDRRLVVVGSTPGPGVDEAPAGELLPGVLGEGPWARDQIDGYTAARSLHAVLDVALQSGDLRRAAISSAMTPAGRLDLGFGPEGISVGPPDGQSPTGVRITEWRALG